MANLKARFAIICVLGLPIFVAAAIFGPAAIDLAFRHRPPERYLIPAGFTGWTRINYRQANAPPLPIEDGRRLLKLNAQGMLATSTSPQTGHGKDDYFYYSIDTGSAPRRRISNAGVCKGGMIWGVTTLVDEQSGTPFTRFFVGTESQYRHEVDSKDNLPACD